MTKLSSIIKDVEGEFYKFIPNKAFYELTGINRKRWGMLVRGEKDPTLKEAKLLSDFFNISIVQLLD